MYSDQSNLLFESNSLKLVFTCKANKSKVVLTLMKLYTAHFYSFVNGKFTHKLEAIPLIVVHVVIIPDHIR